MPSGGATACAFSISRATSRSGGRPKASKRASEPASCADTRVSRASAARINPGARRCHTPALRAEIRAPISSTGALAAACTMRSGHSSFSTITSALGCQRASARRTAPRVSNGASCAVTRASPQPATIARALALLQVTSTARSGAPASSRTSSQRTEVSSPLLAPCSHSTGPPGAAPARPNRSASAPGGAVPRKRCHSTTAIRTGSASAIRNR